MKEFVEFMGLEFEVEAEYIEYRPATYLQPAEGGYYEFGRIYYDDKDVTHLLLDPKQIKEGDALDVLLDFDDLSSVHDDFERLADLQLNERYERV